MEIIEILIIVGCIAFLRFIFLLFRMIDSFIVRRLRNIDKIENEKKAIKIMHKEKTQGFTWLTTAYADYFYLQDMKTADYLERKPHPAMKGAESVRDISKKNVK